MSSNEFILIQSPLQCNNRKHYHFISAVSMVPCPQNRCILLKGIWKSSKVGYYSKHGWRNQWLENTWLLKLCILFPSTQRSSILVAQIYLLFFKMKNSNALEISSCKQILINPWRQLHALALNANPDSPTFEEWLLPALTA
jgi:hypothetical protein